MNAVGSWDNGYPWVHRVVMGRGPRDFWNVGHAPWLLDLEVGDMGVSLFCETSPGCTFLCTFIVHFAASASLFTKISHASIWRMDVG